jgi:hypothetical protein
MGLHLVKLCVGAEAIEDLAAWQRRFCKRLNLEVPYHTTRMIPKRTDEVLDGGSLYWVIKGLIQVRQRLTGIEPFEDGEGVKRCRLVLDPDLIPTKPYPRRPFQGWRYLRAEDAPGDLPPEALDEDMPAEMRRDLLELGLL